MPAEMDFSGFRDTGELSDTTVLVEGKEFKLHKFPLYIKSDFFRALARNPPKETIELTDFPGGAKTFEMVANYCYNVKITVTKENVCGLRCAAEFLQMNSRGNLADVADRFLQDTLTSAKLGRHLGCIMDLVLQCKELGAIAEQAGVVEKCLCSIVDCWLLSTKFTKRLPSDRLMSTLTDQEVFERICSFPLEWFVQLVEMSRKKNVRPNILAQLVQTYINKAVKKTNGQDLLQECIDTEEAAKKEADKTQEEEVTQADEPAQQAETQETDEQKAKAADDNDNDTEAEESQADDQTEPELEVTKEEPEDTADGTPVDKPEDDDDDEAPKDVPERPQNPEPSEEEQEEAVDLKEVLDAIVPQLPDTILFADLLSAQWTLSVLLLAESLECECRPQLRRLVGHLLHRLTPRQLSAMPAEVLTDVVKEACGGDQEEAGQNSLVCGVIDSYLHELAERGELNVDTFTTMVQAVPKDYRLSHDTLFQVLEALLQSDKVKLTDEQKSALMDTVDFGRLSESTLQRAYESDLVPQAHVTKAALALCARLRTELETARSVIKAQEDEMTRYGLGGRVAPYYARHSEPVQQASVVSSSSSKLRYQAPGITYTYPSGAISSLSSDLELQLALDSIETRQRASEVAAAAAVSHHADYTYGSSYSDSSYYDDPLDRESYRSKAYYRNSYDRYNYRY